MPPRQRIRTVRTPHPPPIVHNPNPINPPPTPHPPGRASPPSEDEGLAPFLFLAPAFPEQFPTLRAHSQKFARAVDKLFAVPIAGITSESLAEMVRRYRALFVRASREFLREVGRGRGSVGAPGRAEVRRLEGETREVQERVLGQINGVDESEAGRWGLGAEGKRLADDLSDLDNEFDVLLERIEEVLKGL